MTGTFDFPRVIAVTSGKGGVGKTNIVGNLAIAFARMGKKILIIDADLGLANIDIIFNLRPRYNISHVINGEKQLSEVWVETPEKIKIIPAGSGFNNLTHLTEGQKLNLMGEFEALDDSVDIVLIDTGAGISSNVIYFNLAAEECIIVSTFEPTSITDAYAMMKVMFTQHGSRRFKLLVNMVKNADDAKSVYASLSRAAERFLKGVVVEYIGYIPADDYLSKAVIQRNTVMNLFPNAVSSKMFARLGRSLALSPRHPESDGNIQFFLKRFLDYKTEQTNTN
jgi:flagellar biosynthesis protein FlhG